MTSIGVGAAVPDVRLTDSRGAKHSLADALKKGPVALAFFKVSCPICQYTWPFLERVHKAYGNEKVTLWGIAQDDARGSNDYAEEFGSTFPLLLDEDGYPVSNAFGITNVPTLILVGADGKATVSEHGFSRKAIDTVSKQFALATGKAVAQIFQASENVPDYKPG